MSKTLRPLLWSAALLAAAVLWTTAATLGQAGARPGVRKWHYQLVHHGICDHSAEERRELVIGHSVEQRLLIISFTERGRRTRLIGAREATARERRDYEQNCQKKSTT